MTVPLDEASAVVARSAIYIQALSTVPGYQFVVVVTHRHQVPGLIVPTVTVPLDDRHTIVAGSVVYVHASPAVFGHQSVITSSTGIPDVAGLDHVGDGIAKRAVVAVYAPCDSILVAELAISAIGHILRPAKTAALVLCCAERVSSRASEILGVAGFYHVGNWVAKCAAVAVYAPRNPILVFELAIRAISDVLRSAESTALILLRTERISGRYTAPRAP